MTSFLSALVMYSKYTVRLEKGHLYIGGCILYIIIKNIYENTFERYVIFFSVLYFLPCQYWKYCTMTFMFLAPGETGCGAFVTVCFSKW